jgi:adenosylcobinamide-GDP ribazoletransferase
MKRFILAVQFLTIFPIKKRAELSPDEPSPEEPSPDEAPGGGFLGSMAFFPVVGALQGLILVIAYYILSAPLSPPVVSALLVVILVITNGGLHLDGLADTVDGLAGGATPEERLSIMRDHTTGALGVVSLVLLLLVKYAAITSIPVELKPGILFVFPIAGRWAMVPFSFWGIKAREDGGLGSSFTGASSKILLTATVITAAVSLFILGFRTLLVLFAIGALAYAATVYFRGKLGGITGDVFGFVSELGEVLFLLGALILC